MGGQWSGGGLRPGFCPPIESRHSVTGGHRGSSRDPGNKPYDPELMVLCVSQERYFLFWDTFLCLLLKGAEPSYTPSSRAQGGRQGKERQKELKMESPCTNMFPSFMKCSAYRTVSHLNLDSIQEGGTRIVPHR